MKLTYTLSMMTMLFGTMITLTSSNWLVAWMGMEMTLLGFMPLMNSTKFINSKESMMKYFMIQTIASSLFLFLALSNWNMIINLNIWTLFPLALKLAAAPLHFWLPSLMEFLTLETSFFLLTWQKLAPLFLVSFLQTNMTCMFATFSVIFGSISMLNQTSIKKILAFSSVTHIGWILLVTNFKWIMILYLLLYSLNLKWVFFTLKKSKNNYISMLAKFSMSEKFNFILAMFSLSGFPPFFGFFPKLIIINILINSQMLFILLIFLMSSLFNTYIYTKMLYPLLLNNKMNNLTFSNFSYLNNMMMIMMMVLIFLLIMN